MSSSRPTAVLFDLDGTLVDTIALLLASMRHAFDTCGTARVPTDAEWIAGIGTPLVAQLRAFAATDAEVDRLVAAYRSYQRVHHDAMTRAYEGIVPLVERLRAGGHPLGIVTSKANDIAERTLAHVGLLAPMDVVIGADSVARHKPDPEPVRVALERLGVAPADAVFVGDSPHDVASGNAAGVRTIGVLWGPFSRETLAAVRPTRIVETVAELEAVLAAG